MVYNRILFTQKKERNNVICNMDGPTEHHTKWSQKQKDKCYITSLICEIQNMTLTNLSTKQTHRHREQTCGCQGEEGMGEGWITSLGLADANCHIEKR